MHIDRACLDAFHRLAPDLFIQLLATDDPAGMGREQLQHPGLAVAEVRLLVTAGQFQSLGIDCQRADGKPLPHRTRRIGPPQYRSNTRQQFFQRERLGHIIIGAHIQPGDLFAFLPLGRQHNNRRFQPLLTPDLAKLLTADLRQHQIQQNQVKPPVGNRPLGVQTVLDHRHGKLMEFQKVLQPIPDLRLILNNQNALSRLHTIYSYILAFLYSYIHVFLIYTL